MHSVRYQNVYISETCKLSIVFEQFEVIIVLIFIQAHYIKDRRCNTTRAVFSLESSYKWALSGTPLQNRVGELYSLVSIVHITICHYSL